MAFIHRVDVRYEFFTAIGCPQGIGSPTLPLLEKDGDRSCPPPTPLQCINGPR